MDLKQFRSILEYQPLVNHREYISAVYMEFALGNSCDIETAGHDQLQSPFCNQCEYFKTACMTINRNFSSLGCLVKGDTTEICEIATSV